MLVDVDVVVVELGGGRISLILFQLEIPQETELDYILEGIIHTFINCYGIMKHGIFLTALMMHTLVILAVRMIAITPERTKSLASASIIPRWLPSIKHVMAD